jgi:hypothetical protein
MLEQFQDARAVTGAQTEALMACDDLLGDRQRRPHDERGQVEALVGSGCSENPLLFAGGTKLDTVVSSRRRCRHEWLLDSKGNVRTVYGQDHLPSRYTVEVLHLEGGRWVVEATGGGAGTVALPPFEAVPLDLTLLWEIPEPSA